MSLEPHKRIPQHAHSDRNDGGPIHAPAIIAAVGGGSGGGSSSGTALLVSGTPDAISPTSAIRPVHGLTTTNLGGGVAQLDVDETLLDGSLIPGIGDSSSGMTPYYIPVDEMFTVPLYRQALFSEPIEVDGALVVNGLLLGVD